MCYYCRKDGIKNLKEHNKTCEKFLKSEKKSKRVGKQIYFGKKKKATRKKQKCKNLCIEKKKKILKKIKR